MPVRTAPLQEVLDYDRPLLTALKLEYEMRLEELEQREAAAAEEIQAGVSDFAEDLEKKAAQIRERWTCQPTCATVLESPPHRALEAADRVFGTDN